MKTPQKPGQTAGHTVAILCASGRSIYKHMPNTQVYDRQRNAETYRGKEPVVAHPPCRTWSKYLRHCAKPPDAKREQALAFFCLEKTIQNGGVLEQPAGSLFWEAAGLPMPYEPADPLLYTIYVEQSWFGYASRKPTWLLIAGVPRENLPQMSYAITPGACQMPGFSSFARSRTMPAFAEFLCNIARLSWWQLEPKRTAKSACQDSRHAIKMPQMQSWKAFL